MTDNAPKRRHWKRGCLVVLLFIILLVVAAYSTLTSEWFLRGQIERIGSAQLGGEVTVGGVDFGIFRGIQIDNLSVTGPGPEQDHVNVTSLEADFGLIALLTSGRIDHIAISGVEGTLTRRADGTISLLSAMPPSEASDESGGGSLDIGGIAITAVTITLTDHATGLPEPLEAQIALDQMMTGSIRSESGLEGLEFQAQLVRLTQGDHTDVREGVITGEANAQWARGGDVTVAANLQASGFEGQWRGTSVSDTNLTLLCDVQTSDSGVITVNTAEIDLTRSGQTAAHVEIAGEVNANTREGTLTAQITEVNARALELVWARPGGVDYGDALARANVEAVIAAGGERFDVTGSFHLSDLSVDAPSVSAQRTPPINLDVDTGFTVDMASSTLRVTALETAGTLRGQPLLTTTLEQPISIVWSGDAQGDLPAASLSFELSDLDLAEVRPLLPSQFSNLVRAGVVSANGRIDAAAGGEQIAAAGSIRMGDLVLAPEGNVLPALSLVSDFSVMGDIPAQQCTLERCETVLSRGGTATGRLEVVGDIDGLAGEGTLQILAEGFDLALAGPVVSQPGVFTLASGTMDTSTLVTLADGGNSLDVSGRTSWTELSATLGVLGGAPVPVRQGMLELNTHMRGQNLEITSALIDMRDRGRLRASGQITTDGTGQLALQAENLDMTLADAFLPEEMPVEIAEGRYTGDIGVTLDDQTQTADIDGVVSLRRWEVVGLAGPPPAVDVRAMASANSAGEVTIDRATVDLGERGRVEIQGTADATGQAQITARPEAVDLALVTELLGDMLPVQIQDGAATGVAEIAMGPDLMDVSWDGSASLRRWEVEGLAGAAPAVEIQAAASANYAGEVTIDRATVDLGERGRVEIQGTADATGRAQITTRPEAVDLALVTELLGDMLPLQIQDGAATGVAEIAMGTEAMSVNYSGGLALRRWTMPGLVDAPPPLETEGTASIALGSDWSIGLENVDLELASGGAALGHFTVEGNFSPETFEGDLAVTLQRADLGRLLPIVNQTLDASMLEGVIAEGNQTLAITQGGQAIQAQGQMTLAGVLRLPSGSEALNLTARNSVSLTPNSLEIRDTEITTRLGDGQAETVTLAALADLTGARPSTIALTGGNLDLTPYLALLRGDESAPAAPRGAGAWSLTLPNLPDPGAMRLRGDVIFDRIVIDTLTLDQPTLALRWERYDAASPDREISLPTIDMQIVGPRHTGHLTGDLLLMQEGEAGALDYSVNMTMTETDYETLLPVLAPGLVDKIRGSFSLTRCQLSGRGPSLPRDLNNLQGGITIALSEGEFTRVPLLDAIVRSTGMESLRRLQFFEGELNLRPDGDHMRIDPMRPFWVRGDLSLLSASGNVYWDNRQALSLSIGLHRDFPGLGDLMGRTASGIAFPADTIFPEYRMFPLPINSEGTWAQPRISLGLPNVGQIIPGLINLVGENR